MRNELDPIVDNWYAHRDKGQKFLVVKVDDDLKLVEIQHFDGGIEEVTFTDWKNMRIELCEAPQNWTGPVDIAETDDLGTEVTDTSKEDWGEGAEELRRPVKEKAPRIH